MKRFAVLLPAFLAGCLSHLPPDGDPQHLQIPWSTNFEASQREAQRSGKPMLVCIIAGDLTKRC